jgi:hypothetical protein
MVSAAFLFASRGWTPAGGNICALPGNICARGRRPCGLVCDVRQHYLFKSPIMKTSRKIVIALAMLTTSSALLAGPGTEYWLRHKIPVAGVSKPIAATTGVCPDGRAVPVYEVRQDWPNGKGTRKFVKVGEKQVCTRCDTPSTTMRPSGHNGKGPMQPVTLSAAHDCTVDCPKS